MKYSLSKQVKKTALIELFEILSDSIDEGIPDILWEGSEFEVRIDQEDVVCAVDYVSSKKGGDFSIKITWLTPEGKKTKKKPKAKSSKEKEKKKKREELLKKASRSLGADPPPGSAAVVDEEEDWDYDESAWRKTEELDDWDDDDYSDEW